MLSTANLSLSSPDLRAYARARMVLINLVVLSLWTVSTLCASTVTATWAANPEASVVGYRLSYGTVSGTYTTTIDVGNVTTNVMSVPGGQTYYFAVQAYNSSGLSSSNSTEVAFFVPASSSPTLTSLSPPSGAVGTAVTITGANFGATKGTSTVTFNGTLATPTRWTATSVVVPVPAGATSGNVVVTVGGVASNPSAFTVTGRATATVAFVQLNYATPQTATAKVGVPFKVAQTAGNLNVVVVGWADLTRSVVSVTDTKGNVYTRAIGPTVQTGVASQSIYYAKNIGAAAAGANTVTVTFTGAATFPDIRVVEYSGVDPVAPLDVAVGASGTTTTANSGTVTTTTANDVLLAANYVQGTTSSAGSGFTQRVITDPDSDLVEDRLVSAVGSYSGTAAVSTGGWIMQMVAFRVASVSTASPVLTASLASTSLATTNEASGAAGAVTRPRNDMMRRTDYDGDGKSDIVVYRSGLGMWEILQSHTGFATRVKVTSGTTGDLSVAGDYDGDGKTDLGLFRPATGQWDVPLSSTNSSTSLTLAWGGATDVPVVGDYDGDGQTDLGIFHPATGQWAILLSSTNYATSLTLSLGTATDVPVAADYDGDGKTDIGIFRPATGQWSVLVSSTNYMTGLNFSWGTAADTPVPGDYDGDGKTDLGIFHPATGLWDVLLSSTDYATSLTLAWGTATGIPFHGDYDGDGKTDPGIFNPSTGRWEILFSGANYTTSMTSITQ